MENKLKGVQRSATQVLPLSGPPPCEELHHDRRRSESVPTIHVWSPRQGNVKVIKPAPLPDPGTVHPKIAKIVNDIDTLLGNRWMAHTHGHRLAPHFEQLKQAVEHAAKSGYPSEAGAYQALLSKALICQEMLGNNLRLLSELRSAKHSLKMHANRIKQESLLRRCNALIQTVQGVQHAVVPRTTRPSLNGAGAVSDTKTAPSPVLRPVQAKAGAQGIRASTGRASTGLTPRRRPVQEFPRQEPLQRRTKQVDKGRGLLADNGLSNKGWNLSVDKQIYSPTQHQFLGSTAIPGVRKAEACLERLALDIEAVERMGKQVMTAFAPEFAMLRAQVQKAAMHLSFALDDANLEEYKTNLLQLFKAWQGVQELGKEFAGKRSLAAYLDQVDTVSEKLGEFLDEVDEAVFDDLDSNVLAAEMLAFARQYLVAAGKTLSGQAGEFTLLAEKDELDDDFKRHYPFLSQVIPDMTAMGVASLVADAAASLEQQVDGADLQQPAWPAQTGAKDQCPVQ